MDQIAATIAQLTWKPADLDQTREVALADGMTVYRNADGTCQVDRLHTRTGQPRTDHFANIDAAVAALGMTTAECDGMTEPWGYVAGYGWMIN
jgi:hypothetical protein